MGPDPAKASWACANIDRVTRSIPLRYKQWPAHVILAPQTLASDPNNTGRPSSKKLQMATTKYLTRPMQLISRFWWHFCCPHLIPHLLRKPSSARTSTSPTSSRNATSSPCSSSISSCSRQCVARRRRSTSSSSWRPNRGAAGAGLRPRGRI
jgi:hypothetical protein